MSSQYKFNESENFEELKPHNKVKLTELLSRIKEEKKLEKKKKRCFRRCGSFSSNSFWHYFNYLI